MKTRWFGELKLWQFHDLSSYRTINHYISGRIGGMSKGEVGGLNISFKVGDLKENVSANRKLVAQAMGVTENKLIFPSQTHSVNIKLVKTDTSQEELENTDALISNTPGLLISVMSADCVPILLYDDINKAVGAVHAGWRGSVGKIVAKTVEAMLNNFGTDPTTLKIGIGPSICQDVYEVGEDVFKEVEKHFGTSENVIKYNEKSDKAYINLWEINAVQLRELGVPKSNIEVAGVCTYSNSDDFFSARKSENRAGRFAAGIVIL